MRALAGGIPRALKSHRSAAGREYGAFLRSLTQRLGKLPPDCKPVLRELGRISIELNELAADIDHARARHRRTDERRLCRRRNAARRDFARLLAYVEGVAASQPKTDWFSAMLLANRADRENGDD